MSYKAIIAFTALVALGLLSSGCAVLLLGAGAAAGAGTVAYVHGELRATEDATLEKAWTASLVAMKDLEFKVITQNKDAAAGTLVARSAEDKKIHVALKKQSDKITEIRIRVGTFGNQSLSRLIHEKIKQHL